VSKETYRRLVGEGHLFATALDGLDGSGKGSCTDVLAEKIASRGYNVLKIDYPQYETAWGRFLTHLLKESDEGLDIEQRMAVYAANRLETVVPIWRQVNRLAQRNDLPIHLLFDRYVTSNILTLAYYHAHESDSLNPQDVINNYYDFFWNVDGLFVHELALEKSKVIVPQVAPEVALASLAKDETRTGADLYEKPSVQQLAHALYCEAALIDPRISILDQQRGAERMNQETLATEIVDTILLIPEKSDQSGEVHHIRMAAAVKASDMRMAHLRDLISDFNEVEDLMRRTVRVKE
jgi:thymidylate kinase